MHSQFTAFTFPLRTITILIFRIFTSFLFYGVVPTMHASLNIVVWFCLFSGTSSKQQKRNISYFFCVWLLAFSFMLCNFLMWYIAVVHSCSLLCNIAWYECSLIHSSIPLLMDLKHFSVWGYFAYVAVNFPAHDFCYHYMHFGDLFLELEYLLDITWAWVIIFNVSR